MREPWKAIRSGTPVYDIAGKKRGTVSAYDPADGYLPMRRGVRVHRPVDVPLRALEQAGGDAISLSRSTAKAEVRRRPWDRPPWGPTIVYEGAAPSARPPDRRDGRSGHATKHRHETTRLR